MAVDIDFPLGITFIGILVCLVIDLTWLVRKPRHLPCAPYILIVALLVRLIPALILTRGAGYEMDMFERIGRSVLAGQNIYFERLAYPYLPLQLYWFAAARSLTDAIGISFTFWLKLPSILADTAIVFLIYQAVRRTKTLELALWSSWIYALNPVAILVPAFQGQFDAIPLFLMLAAWYVLEFYPSSLPMLMLSSGMLGLGVLSKTWPALFLPIALLRLPQWRLRAGYLSVAIAVPVAAVLFYEWRFAGSWLVILRRATSAGAISGWWGYSSILNAIVEITGRGASLYATVVPVGKLVAVAGGLMTIWFTRQRSAVYALLLTVLVMFALVPNLGLQGLSWLIPLALLLQLFNAAWWITVGASLHMVISYWGMHLAPNLYVLLPRLPADIIIQLSSLLAWGVIVVWCVQLLLGRPLLPPVADRRPTSAMAPEARI
jgi:hypothetical protein